MNPADGTAFLWLWIGFLVLMIVAIGAVFTWAVRSRQFTNQERARHLALRAEIPGKKKDADKHRTEQHTPRRPTT